MSFSFSCNFPCCLVTFVLRMCIRVLIGTHSHPTGGRIGWIVHNSPSKSEQFTEYCSISPKKNLFLVSSCSLHAMIDREDVCVGLLLSNVKSILKQQPNMIAYNGRDGQGAIHKLSLHALTRSEKNFTWYKYVKIN